MKSGKLSVLALLMVLMPIALAQTCNDTAPTCPDTNFMFSCVAPQPDDSVVWVIGDVNGCQLFNYTADNDSLLMDSFGDNNQFSVTRVTNGISRLWFPADQNDASVRTVYCVNEDAPYTRCFPSNNDLLLCRRLRVISKPISPAGFTYSISGTGSVVVTLNWLRLANYNCDFNFVLIVNGMTTVLMNNVTMYTVPTISVGQLNTFQLYLNDSTGYSSARVTQRLDANPPPAVTFDRVAFVPSGDNFNIQFYWNNPRSDTPAITYYNVRYNFTSMEPVGSGSGENEPNNIGMQRVNNGAATRVEIVNNFVLGGTYFVEVTPYNIFGMGNSLRRIVVVTRSTTPSPVPSSSPTPTPTPSPTDSTGGLSTGAIIGIVVGAIVAVVLVIVLVVVVVIIIVVVRAKGGDKDYEMEQKGTKL